MGITYFSTVRCLPAWCLSTCLPSRPHYSSAEVSCRVENHSSPNPLWGAAWYTVYYIIRNELQRTFFKQATNTDAIPVNKCHKNYCTYYVLSKFKHESSLQFPFFVSSGYLGFINSSKQMLCDSYSAQY